MRTLEHRGQKIICQYIDDNFGRILAKKNIKYSILPVFSDNYTEEQAKTLLKMMIFDRR